MKGPFINHAIYRIKREPWIKVIIGNTVTMHSVNDFPEYSVRLSSKACCMPKQLLGFGYLSLQMIKLTGLKLKPCRELNAGWCVFVVGIGLQMMIHYA